MSLHYGAPYGYDMVEIPSYPPVSESTNFASNTFKFTIEQEPDTCFVGKNCYIALQLNIVQTREDKKLIQYIKYYFNKYIKYFDSYNFKIYNYDEIIKVLETCILSIQAIKKIDNKLK